MAPRTRDTAPAICMSFFPSLCLPSILFPLFHFFPCLFNKIEHLFDFLLLIFLSGNREQRVLPFRGRNPSAYPVYRSPLVGQQLAPLRPGALLSANSTLSPLGRVGVRVVVLPHNLLPSGEAGAMRTTLTASRSASFVRGSFFAAAAQTSTLARGHSGPCAVRFTQVSIGRRFFCA